MNDLVPTNDNADAMLSLIERAARDPDFDVQKFATLLDRHEHQIRQRQERIANAAMSAVQREIRQVIAKSKNPTFTNPYAKLEQLDEEARPIYSAHGFSVRYATQLTDKSVPPPPPGWQRLVLKLSHDCGFMEEIHLDGPSDVQAGGARGRTPIQAVGSTNTYLRRYTLQMALNLVTRGNPDDDDGSTKGGGSMRDVADKTLREREQPTPREWLDDFQKECAAAQNMEQAEAILKRFPDGATPEWMADKPNAKATFERIRQALIDRIWPMPPSDDDPKQAA